MSGVTRSTSTGTAAFDCLSNRRRRVALSVLGSRDGLPVADLAAEVADRYDDGTTEDAVRVSLHQVDLPKLEAAELVERDDETVRATDHPVFADPAVQRAIDPPTDDEHLDAVYGALADTRRQHTLRVLSEMRHALAPREVSVLVAARETDDSPHSVPAETIGRVHASLHHVHLPKLARAGLVERRDDDTLTDDVADLPVTWCHTDVERPSPGVR